MTLHPRNINAQAAPSSESDTAMLAASPVVSGESEPGPNCSQARLASPEARQIEATVDCRIRRRGAVLFAVVLSCVSAGCSLFGLFMPDSLFAEIVQMKLMTMTTAMTLSAAAVMLTALHITGSPH